MTKEELAENYATEQMNSLDNEIKNLLKEAYLRGFEDGKQPVVNNPGEKQSTEDIDIVYNNLDLPSGLLWSDYLGDKNQGYGRHTHKLFLYNEIKHLALPSKEQVLELFKYTKKEGGRTGDLYKSWYYASFLSVNGLKYSLVQDHYSIFNFPEFWLSDEVEDDPTMAYVSTFNKNEETNEMEVSFEKAFKGERHSVVVVKETT